MLKVILVDDEIPVIIHLQALVPWDELSLEVVCTANSADDVLKFFKKEKADILITDIRMPGMDGLTLAGKVKALYPDTQIIILSGYSDFAYAKQAISLQAAGYCLKPIDAVDLKNALRIAANKILADGRSNGDYLLDAIEENDASEIKNILSELSLNTDKLYLAASVNVHNIGVKIGAGFTYKLAKHKYLYISNSPFSYTEAEKIIAFSKDMGGISIYKEAVSIEKLGIVLDDLLSMAYQFFINNTPTLCSSMPNPVLTEEIFKKLNEAKKTPETLKIFLTELSSANCSLIFDMKAVFKFYKEIVYSGYPSVLYELDEAMLHGYVRLLNEFKNFSEMLTKTADSILPKAISEISESYDAGSGKSFLAILGYMEKNYSKTVSLKLISEEFHLNANYISQLIKSETGLTYTQYLTELRIGKAKELLEQTAMSLAEISEAVGFNDYFYFIKKFKNAVGVTPGKYRAC